MAVEFERETISSGYNPSKMNNNFQRIQTALQDAVSRSGDTPNTMEADLDLNGNDLLNGGQGQFDSIILNGSPISASAYEKGDKGDPGEDGADGADGADGVGIPVGGTTGQRLAKNSNTNYDTIWVTDNYQPLDSDLTSWAAVTRASGVDTFVATPSSANLRALLTDETGTGSAVFSTSPSFTTDIRPSSNDGAALGLSGTAFSDLFLANGGVINWNAANVTVAHSDKQLTVNNLETLLISSPSGNGVTHPTNQLVFRSNDLLLPHGTGSHIRFQTPNTSGTFRDGAEINGGLVDATAGGEDGLFDFSVYRAGTSEVAFTIDASISSIFPGGTNNVYKLGHGLATWSGLYLGNQGVVNWNNGDAQIRHDTNVLFFEGASTGYGFDAPLLPSVNDGTSLGIAALSWSDLFLATGAVINYNNGDTTLTHSTGRLVAKAVNGIGYNTGSGGAVTQATSRTTGVTLNTASGAITLVSAAGSTTFASFTVTNSTVAATDTIIINQKSGTNLYEIHITAVADGSFRVSFRTTGGTTSEQPVFNFSVIKAVAS